jgi:hypothetical protein
VLGFVLVLAGALLAALPAGQWAEWLVRTGEPWTTETSRWLLVSIVILAGVSFLRSKPIAFLVTSALVLVSIYSVDRMIGGGFSAVINAAAGLDVATRVMPVIAVAIGYLIHTAPRVAVPSVQSICGLVLVALGGLGVVNGWYDDSLHTLAARLGREAVRFVADWTEECTWALALVLVAIGVASSRTKPILFLNAVLLGALAYYCIQAGAAKLVTFPTTNGIEFPDLQTVSLANVVLWRWVVAGELLLLALILLHLALGIGALSVAFAMAWMFAGLSAYHEIGKLSLVRLSQQVGQQGPPGAPGSQPLPMWGLPFTPPAAQNRPDLASGSKETLPRQPSADETSARRVSAGRPGSSRARTQESRDLSQAKGGQPLPLDNAKVVPPDGIELERANAEAQAGLQQGLVREITPLVWMYLTAILAGVIGVTGFSLLSRNEAYRTWLTIALVFIFGLACADLWVKWPRDRQQSWLQWAAGFRLSRYHEYVIWLAFLGSLAVAGIFALRRTSRPVHWVHASVYCIFLGTILSLISVAVLIRFGGFTTLPVWTYIALAAGQSSLAWLLMMHLSLSSRQA